MRSVRQGRTRLPFIVLEHGADAADQTAWRRLWHLDNRVVAQRDIETTRRGPYVALHISEHVILEYQRDQPTLSVAPPFLEGIQIVPAVGVERVLHKRCAHNKAHLIPIHAGLELREHLLRDGVPLLHVDLIHERDVAVALGVRGTAAESCAERCNKSKANASQTHAGLGRAMRVMAALVAERLWACLQLWPPYSL